MAPTMAILGSTGSIGRQTFDVCRFLGVRVVALTAHSSAEKLAEQAVECGARYAAVYERAAAERLRSLLEGTGIEAGPPGEEGLVLAACHEGAQRVMVAVSGSVGLAPTLAAIDAGKEIALANKETLVCGGSVVMPRVREKGALLIPVDSEHSAIHECLSRRPGDLSKIILTGSGGPFRGWTRAQTAAVTPEMAVRHPNWSMGAKISVDSATMMNKGLELIEAMHLFSVPPEQIEIVVHPESIVHSAVEFRDGSILAPLGPADMRVPIQYAVTWPERLPSQAQPISLAALGRLTFEEPDFENTPCLALALDCARRGGTAPAVMSAANEAAVAAFLGHRIGYNEIYDRVAEAVEALPFTAGPTLGELLAADEAGRRFVRERID